MRTTSLCIPNPFVLTVSHFLFLFILFKRKNNILTSQGLKKKEIQILVKPKKSVVLTGKELGFTENQSPSREMLRSKLKSSLRRFSTAINRRHIEDEGDWVYSSEWWVANSSSSRTAFRQNSRHGNGVVSVISHPCSKPVRIYTRLYDYIFT